MMFVISFNKHLDIYAGGAFQTGKILNLRKFGVFEFQVRKSRVGRNPNKPETDVMIPRRAVVKFKAGKEMKMGLDKLDLDKLDPSLRRTSLPNV